MTVIRTEKITKKFGELKAVDEISIRVEKGSLFGLLGPNGSGKTTMIKMLTGQIRPTSGSAEILGHDPAAEGIKVRELVGVIPEQETPPSFLPSSEYLSFV